MPNNEVKVTVHDICKLQVSARLEIDKVGDRHQIIKITFEAEVHPAEVARILFMQRQLLPVDVVIQSPQAIMDLSMNQVKTTTGEVLDPGK